MATLYTNGDYIALTPAEFAAYSLIRYSAAEPARELMLGLTVSGTINFASRLGSVSAVIDGWTGNDNITSGSGNDALWGNSGNDSLWGMAGDDLLVGDWDNKDRTGNDALYGGDGNDELIGGTGNDLMYGGNGDDIFSVGDLESGIDQYFGGSGYDAISVRDVFSRGLGEVSFSRLVLNAAASIEFFALDDQTIALHGTDGNDLIDFSGTTALTWYGDYQQVIAFNLQSGNDSFTGGDSNETITLEAGGDRILLGDGDDVLDLKGGTLSGMSFNGGAGHDTLRGSGVEGVTSEIVTSSLSLTAAAGFEVLELDNARFRGTTGADRYDLSGVQYVFGAGLNPFDLGEGNDSFTGSLGDDAVEGGAGRDTLNGGEGTDTLLGGSGADVMNGGQGSDTYEVDDLGDTLTELANEGYDTIRTSLATFTLGATFEALEAEGNGGLFGTGNVASNALTGAGGRDRLVGLDGADTLNGGAGVDTLEGGTGNDTYYVTDGDVIREAAGDLMDVAYVNAATYVLARNIEVMRAQLDRALDGTGNNQSNEMTGSNLADTLRGLEGDDTILSGLGNDSLDGGLGRDTLDAGEGDDAVTGGDGADSLLGGAGNDQMEGGFGRDTLIGGLGNDRFLIGDLDDRVIETYGGGADTVVAFVNGIRLQDFVETIEADVSLIDAVLYGNRGHNSLKGSSGNDKLYGGDGDDTLYSDAGKDTLYGGTGTDTFYIGADAGLVRIVESSAYSPSPDRIFTSAAVTILTKHVDELYITRDTGAVARADSTTYSKLYGGIGNDRLIEGSYMDGGLGADTMIGSAAGGSTFVVDDLGDDVRLVDGGAAEMVLLKLASYVMNERLEKLGVLYAGGAAVIGSGFANFIGGGEGRDTLDGMGGDDTLEGGAGADLLRGGDGNDTFIPSIGRDTLVGGAGDDLYTLGGPGMNVVERAGGGTDKIELHYSVTTFTIPTNIENVTFFAYATVCTATGNELDNRIAAPSAQLYAEGLGGNDTLEGSYNRSTLVGGLGDDTYVLGGGELGVSHEVIELAGEGFDWIQGVGNLFLAANVEGCRVLEGATGNVQGNDLDNVIIGNALGDYLRGLAGDDTLTGAGGDDVFVRHATEGVDHITDFNSSEGDKIWLSGLPGLSSLAANQFKDLAQGAVDATDRIIYDSLTGEVFFDEDGSGAAAAQLILTLENTPDLVARDFMLF